MVSPKEGVRREGEWQLTETLDAGGNGLTNVGAVNTDALGIDGFETVEKDGEIDVGGEQHGPSNKVTYNISDTGRDAYILVWESFGFQSGGSFGLRLRINGYGSATGQDDYLYTLQNGTSTTSDTSFLMGNSGTTVPMTAAHILEYFPGNTDNNSRRNEWVLGHVRGSIGWENGTLASGGLFDAEDFGPPTSFEFWEEQTRTFTDNAKLKVLGVTYL
jgi:hypothetical protein